MAKGCISILVDGIWLEGERQLCLTAQGAAGKAFHVTYLPDPRHSIVDGCTLEKSFLTLAVRGFILC